MIEYLPKIARGYELVIRDDKSVIQLRMRAIDVMPWRTGLMDIYQVKA